jgi:hypothetical protein
MRRQIQGGYETRLCLRSPGFSVVHARLAPPPPASSKSLEMSVKVLSYPFECAMPLRGDLHFEKRHAERYRSNTLQRAKRGGSGLNSARIVLDKFDQAHVRQLVL